MGLLILKRFAQHPLREIVCRGYRCDITAGRSSCLKLRMLSAETHGRLPAGLLRRLPLPEQHHRQRRGHPGTGGGPSPLGRDRERQPKPQVRRGLNYPLFGPLPRQRRLAGVAPRKSSSVVPWPDCAPCLSQPDGGNHPAIQPTEPSSQLSQRRTLLAHHLPNTPAMATAGHQNHVSAVTSHPASSPVGSDLLRSPSLANHPWRQRQYPSLRRITGNTSY